MKRTSWIFFAVLTIISASCNRSKNEQKTVNNNNIDTTVYPVKVIPLEKQKVTINVHYTANLVAFEEVNYAPASPGRIEEIYVEIGNKVSKGSIIAQMDRTQLIQAEEQFQTAKSNFLRMDTLYKLNSISKLQYETVKTQYEVSKASVEFLRKNTTLYSPINGVITGKYFENGELYAGVPNTAAGKAAIVTIMQIDPLKAIINLPERYYPLMKKEIEALAQVDIFPDKEFKAKVYKIYPTVNSSTRTFPVELTINNSNEILRPGMFARISMNLGEAESLLVPANALVKQEGTNNFYIFLAQENNTADKIIVETGSRYDDKIEIISDKVKEGDKIIVTGQDRLFKGSRISIVK